MRPEVVHPECRVELVIAGQIEAGATPAACAVLDEYTYAPLRAL